MTDKQKLDALKMLLDGATYEEVGRKYQVHYAAIYQMFKNVVGERRRFQVQGIYPNLIRWMNDNVYSLSKFAKEVGYSCNGAAKVMLSERGNPQKNTIDKILKLTGMTYEECFAKEKAPEEAATSIKG